MLEVKREVKNILDANNKGLVSENRGDMEKKIDYIYNKLKNDEKYFKKNILNEGKYRIKIYVKFIIIVFIFSSVFSYLFIYYLNYKLENFFTSTKEYIPDSLKNKIDVLDKAKKTINDYKNDYFDNNQNTKKNNVDF